MFFFNTCWTPDKCWFKTWQLIENPMWESHSINLCLKISYFPPSPSLSEGVPSSPISQLIWVKWVLLSTLTPRLGTRRRSWWHWRWWRCSPFSPNYSLKYYRNVKLLFNSIQYYKRSTKHSISGGFGEFLLLHIASNSPSCDNRKPLNLVAIQQNMYRFIINIQLCSYQP